MRTKPSKIKALWMLGIAVGLLVLLEACAARRDLIVEGTYTLAVDPELSSVVDHVTAKRMNQTLTVAGRISSGPGARSGCPGRIQINLVDRQNKLIDSRTASYYSKNCYRYYYSPRSARHLRYHNIGRFSATFWTLPPADTTILLRNMH